MGYSKVLEMFRAVPEAERKLARGKYWLQLDQCACALGIVVPALLATPAAGSIGRAVHFSRTAMWQFQQSGLTMDEAETLQAENDEFYGTHTERFAHVLAWLEEQVAAEKGRPF